MWIFECKDPSYQAFKLGLAAIILLLLAHVIAHLLGGCVCVRSKAEFSNSTPNQQLAIGSLILTWYVLHAKPYTIPCTPSNNSISQKQYYPFSFYHDKIHY